MDTQTKTGTPGTDFTFEEATPGQVKGIAVVGTLFETIPLLPVIALAGCFKLIGMGVNGVRNIIKRVKKKE